MNKTAIVILNWNGEKMLQQFLPSVIKYSGDATVVVADNASTDNSIEILQNNFPSVKIILLSQNFGFAEGYNQAFLKISELGDFDRAVLLNSDVEVSPNWLHPMVEFLKNNPNVAAVQPKLLAFHDKKRFEYAGAAGGFIDKFGYPYCRGRVFGNIEKDNHQYDTPLDIHWASGACMLINLADYKNAGGLDGRFFAHNEEIDLCWRLRIMGRRIVCLPDCHVYHVGGGTLPQGNPRKTYLNFRNNLTMLYKNLPESHLNSVMCWRYWLDRLAAIQALLKGNFADFKAIMKARRDFKAWKNEYKEERLRIQSTRTLPPSQDTSNFTILIKRNIKL